MADSRTTRKRLPRLGVAISSGGAASLAGIGALEVLAEAGLAVEAIAGTSAGAVVGATVAAGRLSDLRLAACEMTLRRVFRLLNFAWPGGGLLSLRSALALVKPLVPPNFDALAIPFAAVATDLLSGEEVLLRQGSILDALRASCSIPGLFPPCRQGDRWLVDGALVNPLPISALAEMGAEFKVGISVLGGDGPQCPAAVEVEATGGGGGWQLSTLLQRLVSRGSAQMPDSADSLAAELATGAPDELVEPAPARPLEEWNPRLLAVLAQSSRIVQRNIAVGREQCMPADFVIEVPTHDIGVFDFHRSADAVERGRLAAERELPRLKRAMQDHRASRSWNPFTMLAEARAATRCLAESGG
jgi:NTE family protein